MFLFDQESRPAAARLTVRDISSLYCSSRSRWCPWIKLIPTDYLNTEIVESRRRAEDHLIMDELPRRGRLSFRVGGAPFHRGWLLLFQLQADHWSEAYQCQRRHHLSFDWHRPEWHATYQASAPDLDLLFVLTAALPSSFAQTLIGNSPQSVVIIINVWIVWVCYCLVVNEYYIDW